jgi:hypothetical protein
MKLQSNIHYMQVLFNIFQFFSNIPYNIWPWLFLLSSPLLIFSAKPHHSVRWRFWRIIIAITIGYILLNFTLHTHRTLEWKAHEKCQHDMLVRGQNPYSFDPCGHLVNIADGASNIFFLVLGWIPAAAYAGFWEFWWRRKYALIISPQGKTYKGKLFSTALIVCSIPVWLFVAFLVVLVLSKFIARLFT